jgi:hypothetical protein
MARHAPARDPRGLGRTSASECTGSLHLSAVRTQWNACATCRYYAAWGVAFGIVLVISCERTPKRRSHLLHVEPATADVWLIAMLPDESEGFRVVSGPSRPRQDALMSPTPHTFAPPTTLALPRSQASRRRAGSSPSMSSCWGCSPSQVRHKIAAQSTPASVGSQKPRGRARLARNPDFCCMGGRNVKTAATTHNHCANDVPSSSTPHTPALPCIHAPRDAQTFL